MNEQVHDGLNALADDVRELKKHVAWCSACPCHEVADRIVLRVHAIIDAEKILDSLNKK